MSIRYDNWDDISNLKCVFWISWNFFVLNFITCIKFQTPRPCWNVISNNLASDVLLINFNLWYPYLYFHLLTFQYSKTKNWCSVFHMWSLWICSWSSSWAHDARLILANQYSLSESSWVEVILSYFGFLIHFSSFKRSRVKFHWVKT